MRPSGRCYGSSGRAEGDTGDAHNKYYNNNEMEETARAGGGGVILRSLVQLLHVTVLRAFC